MLAELIPIKFNKIMQTRSYTVVLLGTDEKKFAIYTDPQIGKLLQMYLTGSERPRPYTHDLMNAIFKGLNIRLKQIVINDIQDTVYYARLFIEQQIGDELNIVEIDSRPSDCITLALMNNVPVYCTKEVFEKTAAVEEI
jgi:bifunctional DNase/RNase